MTGCRVGWAVPLVFGALVSPACGGAWTLDAGTGQAVVTGTLTQSDRLFDGAGNTKAIPRYDKFELQALIEYGATDRFTLMLQPMLQHVDIGAPIDAQRSGLGFSEFGGRLRLFGESSWVVSAQTTVRVPGTFDKSNPAAIGYTDPEIDVRGLLGHSFTAGAWPAFLDVQLAQRFRIGGPPDEFHADVTLGVRPAPSWMLLAQSFNVISEGAGSWGFPSYDYYKLQLSAVYALTPALSLQLGGVRTFAGRNALQESGAVLGIWYKF